MRHVQPIAIRADDFDGGDRQQAGVGQFFFDHLAVDHSQSAPGNRGVDHLVQRAELQPAGCIDVVTAHGGQPVLPDLQAFAIVQDVQQGQGAHIRRLAVDEQFRAGDGNVALHHQQLAAAMAVRFQAPMDDAVHFSQAVVSAGVGHAQADVRVTFAKRAQVRRQPARAPGGRHHNTQTLAQVRHAHGLQGALHVIERLGQLRRQPHAGFGQRQPLWRAHEKRHTQVVFKLFDLSADSPLGDVKA